MYSLRVKGNNGKSSAVINRIGGIINFTNMILDIDQLLNVDLKESNIQTLKATDVLFSGVNIIETMCTLQNINFIVNKTTGEEVLNNNLLIIKDLMKNFVGELNISSYYYDRLTDYEKSLRSVGIISNIK